MLTFAQLFFSICILVMLSGSLILMPLGICMLRLSCQFLNVAGYLVFTMGFLLFLAIVRLFLKSIHR